MRSYDECFTGADMINVLQPYIERHPDLHSNPSRGQVRNLCQLLFDNQIFISVIVDGKKDCFVDGSKLYRLTEYDCDVSENVDTSNSLESSQSNRCKDESGTKQELQSSEVFLITRELVIGKLCQIIDIPFLENILDDQHTQVSTSNSFQIIADEKQTLETCVLEKTLEECKDTNEKCWLEAAKCCFNMQRYFPLPRNKVVGFLNVASHTRLGIFHSFSDFYNSLIEPLIPVHLACIAIGIATANMQNKFKRTTEALQLLMMLVPLERQKHLRELLVFMKTTVVCNLDLECDVDLNAAVYQTFKMAIFPDAVTQVEGSEKLLFFMMDNARILFKTPENFDKFVKEQLSNVQDKQDCLPALTACQQVSSEEYKKQKVDHTNIALKELINTVMDDLKLSLKEKKHKLKSFQKHHPDIFLEYFPEGNF